tara:strand:+ start:509 stop:1084 length:576 start_codon:yes stop_codon:yes gene_type:complete
MPTLDDTTTLQKNVAIAANDALTIANKDSAASSQIQQIPAALAVEGFTHAWVVNYDNATLAADSSGACALSLYTFAANQIVTKARLLVTEAFTNSATMNTCPIDVGQSGDSGDDDIIDACAGHTIGFEENSGGSLTGDNEAQNFTPTASGTLELTFTPSDSATCNNFTAGQVVLLMAITTIADYKDIVPAT